MLVTDPLPTGWRLRLARAFGAERQYVGRSSSEGLLHVSNPAPDGVPPNVSPRGNRTTLWLMIRIALCALTVLYLYSIQIRTSFALLTGDFLDGLIQISVLEHWYNVFRGIEAWPTLQYFYPWSYSLGYNDGYFLSGILYSAGRFAGMDPFIASEFSNVVIKIIGFFAFEAFAFEVFGLALGWSLLGAVAFTISNNIYNESAHTQLLTVSFAPLLGLLLWRCLYALRQASGRGDRSLLAALKWGSLAAALYGAWLLTAFYMAWFMTLFVSFMVVSALMQESFGRGVGWSVWRSALRWPVVLVALIGLLCCLPFLLVYVPKAIETGAHIFQEVWPYAPTPLTLLHIGSQNLLFGTADRAITALLSSDGDDYGERAVGFPPIVAILAVAGIILAWRNRNPGSMLVFATATAAAASCAVVVQINHHSLWYYIFNYFPGGSGVRVTSRFVLFLTFPVVLLALTFLQSSAKRWPGWVIALLAVLLVCEETTSFPGPASLDHHVEMANLKAVPQPPSSCSAFYVQRGSTRRSGLTPITMELYPHNVDAMILSEIFALPTINGFSTFNPPDWNFAAIGSPDYQSRVERYASVHGIQDNLCALDLEHHVWTGTFHTALQRIPLGATLPLGISQQADDQFLTHGWVPSTYAAASAKGRFANSRDADLSMTVSGLPEDGESPLTFEVTAVSGSRVAAAVTLEINGHLITTWYPERGTQVLAGQFPRSMIAANGRIDIRLAVVPPKSSWPFPAPKGSRRIDLNVESIRIASPAPV